MPRMARVVVPGYPHHVTQRGSRNQTTFFRDDDYREYLRLLRANLPRSGVEVWAYCLMPNHVHLVTVPRAHDSLAKVMRLTHHWYARRINARNGWQGHLWQERFHSFVMDEAHLLAAVRYVELNPVRAGLCGRADQWPWSSTGVYLDGRQDPIVNPAPMRERVSDWAAYLAEPGAGPSHDQLRACSNSGRPAGDDAFIIRLETLSGRRLRRRNPGPERRR